MFGEGFRAKKKIVGASIYEAFFPYSISETGGCGYVLF